MRFNSHSNQKAPKLFSKSIFYEYIPLNYTIQG